MRTMMMVMAGASLLAAPALAQTAPAPADPAMQATGMGAAAAGTATQPATGAATGTTAQAGAATPGGTPNVTVGASVSDASGAAVGTVESVANGTATVNTGTAKAGVALSSFAQGPNGLVIGMTKAQIEAAVAQAKPAEVAVGADVYGAGGVKIGKVEAVTGDNATVASATAKAQLPKTGFGPGPNGSLVIGMTAAQFDAAAKAAGGGTKTAGK